MEKSNSTISYEKLIHDYILKQRRFKYLVKEIRRSIESCEYKKCGCSLNEFTKKNWNISQAQAYRYIIAAKVMDQLEEFEIQPNYVNLCKSLYNYAKTPKQLKLLWKTLLKKAGGKPYYINSSHVSKTWKEIFHDKKYTHICHYEEDVIKKVEKNLSHDNISLNNNTTNDNNINNHNHNASNNIKVNAFPKEINNTHSSAIPMVKYNSPLASTTPLTKTTPISPLVNPITPPSIPVLPSTITTNITPLVSSVPLSTMSVLPSPTTTPNISPLVTPGTLPVTTTSFVSTSTVPTTIFVPTPNSTISIPSSSFNQLISLNMPLHTGYYIQPLPENTLSQPYQIHQY